MVEERFKTCNKCKRDLLHVDFYTVPKGSGDRFNLSSICRRCMREKKKTYNASHKKEHAKYTREWRKKNPEKDFFIRNKYENSEKGKSSRRRWARKNRDLLNTMQRERNKTIPLLERKKYHLKKMYGISVDDYNILGAKQGWVCAICETPLSELKKSLFVDHDHKSKRVRGLLCTHCNFLLGYAREDHRNLFRASMYLMKNGKM